MLLISPMVMQGLDGSGSDDGLRRGRVSPASLSRLSRLSRLARLE
jgi:hypothetical protein